MEDSPMKSQPWYEKNLELFANRTLGIDMSERYEIFLPLIPENGHILEAGCGPGRDIKYFLSKGYQVSAYDASPSMVKYASEYTGIEVQLQKHEELEGENLYDGIWSSASFVHTPFEEFKRILPSFVKALKPGGAWFISLTYGENEEMREQGGRFFQDYNEERLRALTSLFPEIEAKRIWRSGTSREGSTNTWVSAVFIKK